MLSDEQFADLCEKLSFEELNKYIAIVRDCEKSGQHYKKKTHYQAILDMAKKDRRVK
jgi:phage anti-repressor protein